MRRTKHDADAFDRAGGVALAVGSWARVVASRGGASTPIDPSDVHRILDSVARLDAAARELSRASAAELVADSTLDVPRNLLVLAASSVVPREVGEAALRVLKNAIGCLLEVDNRDAILKACLKELLLIIAAEPVAAWQPIAAAGGAADSSIAGASPLYVAASECALAVTCIAQSISSLVTHEHCSLLAKCLGGPRTHSLALYYILALIHRFASTEPRKPHCMVLTAASVHRALLDMLSDSPPGGWHATPRGMALHVLAIITEQRPTMIRPLLSPALIASAVAPNLHSEWSEVLEGGFLWVASLVRYAESPSPASPTIFESIVAQHNCVAVAAAGTASSSMRVAAAAATCLRALIECSPVDLNASRILLSDDYSLKSVLDLVLDRMVVTDSLGQRVAQANAALAIAICLARSPENRRTFCGAVRQRLGYELAASLEAVRATLDRLDASFLDNCVLLRDPSGQDMVHAISIAGPVTDVAGTVLECLAGDPPPVTSEQTAAATATAGPAGQQLPSMSRGIITKIMLRGAIELALADVNCAATTSPVVVSAPPTPQPAARRTREESLRSGGSGAGENAYLQAFTLAVKLSKNFAGRQPQQHAAGRAFGRSPQSDHTPLSSQRSRRDVSMAIEKEPNQWRPPTKQVERRTWTAAEVEQRDLFLIHIPWSKHHQTNAAAVRKALDDAKDHLVRLNEGLQTCPVSQYRRRAMLNDMYTNVVPRVVGCLEFLAECTENEEQSDKVLELLRYAGEQPTTAAGLEAKDSCVVDCTNLGEVCAALASL